MTVNTSEYHRTFNILRLSGRMPGGVELARDADRELKEARAKYRGLPDHQAIALLRDDKRRTQKPLAVHDAFEDVGNQHPFRAVRIEEKKDQKFETFATRWELIWSRLVMDWHSRLTPVVDNSGLVIAYFGNIAYKHFLIDNTTPPPSAKPGIKSVEILKNYRLFVGTNEFYGRTDLKVFGDETIARHTVLTDIYGEVMSFEVGAYKDESISSVSLLEIAGAVSLVRAALGLAISLGKTGLRTLTRRPPKPAETWMAHTLPGIGGSSGQLLPTHVHHFGRRTLIAGEDMAASRTALAHSHTESGFYDVAIHGNSFSFRLLEKTLSNGTRVFRDVTARDVANAVRPQLAPGDKIRLFSCSVGVTGGPAQELANELGRTVWAATTAVLKEPTRTAGVIRTAFVPRGGGTFHEFLPNRRAVTTAVKK